MTLETSLKPKLGSQISKNWRQIATKFLKIFKNWKSKSKTRMFEKMFRK
jgi:hypothetical protein